MNVYKALVLVPHKKAESRVFEASDMFTAVVELTNKGISATEIIKIELVDSTDEIIDEVLLKS